MKNKWSRLIIFAVIGVCFCSFFGSVGFKTENNVFASSFAKASCVIEAGSGRILHENNIKQKLPMASTTKIMTAITAIESGVDLDEEFEISEKAVGVSGTSLYLEKGEVFSLRSLLYGLMLISGNDASVAIGEQVGSGVEYFVDMMNEKAKKIGAVNSHFANTHGLDAQGHYTTAYDLALITGYAMKNDIFKEIVSTKNIQISNENGKVRYLKNKNKLLANMQGVNGVKTGFTDDAGRCLVSACKRDGMQLVCVVLNCADMFGCSQNLMEECFGKFCLFDLTKNYKKLNDIEILDGKKQNVSLETKKEFCYPLAKDEQDLIEYEYNIVSKIDAPVKKGEIVGEIKIYFDKELIFCEKIYTIEEIQSKGVIEKIFDILKDW